MRGSPFFDDVSQVEIQLGENRLQVPTFYYDGAVMGAMFPARLGGLRHLMPDARFTPARLAPGVGAVGILCFEYRDSDIGPYSEVSISVALNEPWFAINPPGRAILARVRRRQLYGWVQHLPVTSELARAAGTELYGLPRFIAGIEFGDTAAERVCRLSQDHEHILTLSGKRIQAPRSEQLQFFTRTWLDRQPQSAELKINTVGLGISIGPTAARLEMGVNHPIARELAGLLISQRPIQYQYVPRFEGILYGPQHLTVQLLSRLSARRGADERVHHLG